MTQFGDRIPVLQGTWCVITHVGCEAGTVHVLAVDLCHHVSSCFSFWGKHKLIRLSCSCNYFCSSPFAMPCLSAMISVSARAWASIPADTTQQYLSQTSARRDWDLSWTQYNFPNQTKELNEILQCYLSGQIGHSSVPLWQTDNTACLFSHIDMPWLQTATCVHVFCKWVFASSSRHPVSEFFNPNCSHSSSIQCGIQRIDYNPQHNPCILPVICAQQHHRPQTCKLHWLSVLAR